MGLLTESDVYNWDNSQPFIETVKKNALEQFLEKYKNIDKKTIHPFLFGDEIEYMVLEIDDINKIIKLHLHSDEIIKLLKKENKFQWNPEYANYMVEGTPMDPFNDSIESLLEMEQILQNRRRSIKNKLNDNLIVVSLSSFFRLGCEKLDNHSFYSNSQMLSDDIIGKHIRFYTLTKNIRERRGTNINIKIPIYKDLYTEPECIEMDCMGFGMGCSCLQVTFQLKNEMDARYLYDMLAIISPFMLALTASSPIFKGYLSDLDCRWSVISQSVDDRKDVEMDKIKKSRFDSISYYISNNEYFKNEYNDTNYPINIL